MGNNREGKSACWLHCIRRQNIFGLAHDHHSVIHQLLTNRCSPDVICRLQDVGKWQCARITMGLFPCTCHVALRWNDTMRQKLKSNQFSVNAFLKRDASNGLNVTHLIVQLKKT